MKRLSRILCFFGFHRMVHIDAWCIGSGEIRNEYYRECSRCLVRLDWAGNPIK